MSKSTYQVHLLSEEETEVDCESYEGDSCDGTCGGHLISDGDEWVVVEASSEGEARAKAAEQVRAENPSDLSWYADQVDEVDPS